MQLDQLTGPFALTVAVVVALLALWRDHLRADADDRAQRDRALAGWEAQTSATNRLAEAIEAASRDAESRRRTGDARRIDGAL